MLTAILDGIVALLKEFYGRGPTRAKSYYEDDLVVCLLRGGFSRVEQTLLEGGRGCAGIRARQAGRRLVLVRVPSTVDRMLTLATETANDQAACNGVRPFSPRRS